MPPEEISIEDSLKRAESVHLGYGELVTEILKLHEIAKSMGVENSEEMFQQNFQRARGIVNGTYQTQPLRAVFLCQVVAFEQLHGYLQTITIENNPEYFDTQEHS